ncbi:hypothetical protein GCM10027048_06470 [Hymenobacter coalescens]
MEQYSPFFENSAGRLVDDPRGFLRIVWHPSVTDVATRRELMDQVLAWLVRYQKGKVYADQRFMAPFSIAEQRWIQEQWTPRAVREGNYRCRAILGARDAKARLSSAAVTTPAREQISYCYFDNEPEAVAWLLAQ